MLHNGSERSVMTIWLRKILFPVHLNSLKWWLIDLWKGANGIGPAVCVSLSVHRLSVPTKTKRQHSWHLLAESQLALITELCTIRYKWVSEWRDAVWTQRVCRLSRQIIVFMCYGIMLNKWVLQTYQPDFMKSSLVYHPRHRLQVWRFFSYMFMHVG